ncbi:hypothetical protein K438DRAFT_183719 [Mycena galopus ATCC 62051]|nr:hypothetical protein K438DRAFT_183719 [Mycena galopus ATCC 62051]
MSMCRGGCWRRGFGGGWVSPENCWYGYDCRTMVHKRPHADGKNAHLFSLFICACRSRGIRLRWSRGMLEGLG